MEIGRNCDYQNCNQLDFLPFYCDHCKKSFCTAHRMPDKHSCVFISRHVNDPGPVAVDPKSAAGEFSCAYRETTCENLNQNNFKIKGVVCNQCGMMFCLEHRSIFTHKCNQSSGTRSSQRSCTGEEFKKPPVKIKVKKMHPKVAMMKIKSQAKGDPSRISEGERLYLVVGFSGSVYQNSDKAGGDPISVVVSSRHKCGQVVDQICRLIGVADNAGVDSDGESAVSLFNGWTGESLRLSEEIGKQDVVDSSAVGSQKLGEVGRAVGRVVIYRGMSKDRIGTGLDDIFKPGTPYVW